MDILQWNRGLQIWEVAVPGVDKLDPQYIDPTFAEDITITDPAAGLVLSSATKQWRLTVDDSGVLTANEILAQ